MWLFDWRIFRSVHMTPCPSKGSSHGLLHTVPFHWSSVHYCRNTDRKRQLFKHTIGIYLKLGGNIYIQNTSTMSINLVLIIL